MRKQIVFLTTLLLTFTVLAACQQDKAKRPSPPAQAQCKFSDGKTVTVNYSSPRARGKEDIRRTRPLRPGLAYRRQ